MQKIKFIRSLSSFSKVAGFLLLCSANIYGQTSFGDSITVAIAPEYDEVTGFHRFLFGESYRKLWAAPVKMKVFSLSKEKGGLTIIKKGGGLQTKSLQLQDASGKEWVLRSVQKYPERGLPKKLRATIAKDILQDQVVTSHPYAALTVPVFAKALGILHTNPQIVYLPDDPALGEYRKEFANSVLLFEERQPGKFDTDNTEKVQDKVEEDNTVAIDKQRLLRARLLDLFLGDWDRHEDQWRWEQHNKNDQTVYEPFPRDRDKVYYTTSGILPALLSRQSGKSNLQPFGEKIKRIGSYNYNNRFFDRYFLNELDEEDWKKEIELVQKLLTDELIEKAISVLPDTIYKLSGQKLLNTLKARKNHLPGDALRYYHFLSRNIDIPASDEPELFDIQTKNGGNIGVRIYKLKKDNSRGNIIYQREFKPHLTEELRLFGLGGKDIFKISGETKSSIRLHMIGGDGIDSFYVEPGAVNRRRVYIYDRSDEKNRLPSKELVRLRTSTDSTVNEFDRKSFKYDKVGPGISAQYDLDLGFMMRAGMVYERQGFRREPYAKRHAFFLNYAPVRKSFIISYDGTFIKLFGKNDLLINLLSKGPHYVTNFFGVGNETVFINNKERNINYYRNQFDVFTGNVLIRRSLTRNLRVNLGVGIQTYSSKQENNINQFLNSYDSFAPGENVFSKKFFAGLVGGLEINSPKETLLPTKGFYLAMQFTGRKQTNGTGNTYGQVQTQGIFYFPILTNSIVLANRMGGGVSVGQPAFFQQFQLGGYTTLRGYYLNRFTGDHIFYNNLELRIKLFDFTSYLFPGSFGIIGFNDVGRVWAKNESSQKWHKGYGGGIFIIPADLVLIQAAFAKSEEGTQPYISLGLSF
ncbi:MAG TPA: BamA/TamA family outer membrane protein [Flavisolibacter sp.]|nr:BamA/TamA family outer membrane protein [Flavisolibacter sp.]